MEAAGAGGAPSAGLSAAGQQQLPDIPELINIEGDEEVQYVLLELPPEVLANDLHPGAEVVLKDLDTDTPRLRLNGGAELQGAYADQLGTLMLFRHAAHPSQVGQQRSQQQTTEEPHSSQGGTACKFVALSESRVVFTATPGSAAGPSGAVLNGHASAGPAATSNTGALQGPTIDMTGSSGLTGTTDMAIDA